MGKGRKNKGLMARLLAPLKVQRVTLTEAGKKQAPMRKGTAKNAKKATAKAPPPPLTARQRQVREIKAMYDIGIKDPERLARIISRMLQDANMKDEEAQLKFERLVWEKADKKGRNKDTDG